jgi:polyisoprenoid-binding protein YceI
MFKKVIGILILIAVIVIGFVAYSVFKPPAEASAPITAIPITVSVDTPTQAGLTTSATTQVTGAGSPTATTEAASAPTVSSGATQPAQNGATVYQIVSADSKASFTVDEVLNGSPNTVVGTTDQVAGQIALDLNDPASAQVGTIQVDARTLTTDSNLRNRTIKNQILNSNTYEYITFTPKSFNGLPDQITLGKSYSFTIVGDLTVKDVTKEVSFDVTVTPVDATRLEGTASTTVLYQDFGLVIPKVPSVASVDDQVKLDISFVAVTQ